MENLDMTREYQIVTDMSENGTWLNHDQAKKFVDIMYRLGWEVSVAHSGGYYTEGVFARRDGGGWQKLGWVVEVPEELNWCIKQVANHILADR